MLHRSATVLLCLRGQGWGLLKFLRDLLHFLQHWPPPTQTPAFSFCSFCLSSSPLAFCSDRLASCWAVRSMDLASWKSVRRQILEERRGFEGGRERVGSDYNAPSRADSVKGCVQWYFVHLLISILSHQCTPCVCSTSCLYVHVRTCWVSQSGPDSGHTGLVLLFQR